MDSDLSDTKLGGSGSTINRETIGKIGSRLIPPDPTNLIDPVEVPRPVLLDPTLSSWERTRHLIYVYERVGLLRYGNGVYRHIGDHKIQGDPENWACHKKVSAAAALLIDYKIPPSAWCCWSFDTYTKHMKLKGLPKPIWVWSVTRINRNVEFFWGDGDRYVNKRVLLGSRHRKLIVSWRNMWTALLRNKASNVREIVAVLDEFFPDRSFDRELANARAERDRIQREMEDAGDYGCALRVDGL